MNMDFFDINAYAGRSACGTYNPAVSGQDLRDKLGSAGIKEALVWHIAQCETSAQEGNNLVKELVAETEGLYGVWAALPPQADEQPRPEAFFQRMEDSGIRALRLFPNTHRYLLNRTVFGGFLDAVAERKIPVLFSVARNDTTWDQIYAILNEYPHLTCVVCDTGVWGTDRYFRPLVESFPNVFIETSLLSLGEGVIETFVRDYGPQRLLFGSGFPERIPEAAMLQLIHADISREAREAIAFDNARNLISEVQL